MLLRVVRAVLGSVLLLIGLPLLLAGGILWFAMQHQDPGGAYRASLAEISTDGYAIVAPDVDALLRRDAPFARGGRTTLRVTAQTDAGPAFVGLAPAAEVAAYLADVPYAQVHQVRLARGPLPVTLAPVDGPGEPGGAPHEQPFWLVASATGSVEWVPAELQSRQLALVVMARDGSAPLAVDLVAEVRPQWLGSSTFGALMLGTILVLLAVAALAWPARAREIVYVVPPAQVPEIAAHLGVPVPTAPPPVPPISAPPASTARVSVPPAAVSAPPAAVSAPPPVPPISAPLASTAPVSAAPAPVSAAPLSVPPAWPPPVPDPVTAPPAPVPPPREEEGAAPTSAHAVAGQPLG